jgi:hypothetical protein
VPRFLPLDVSRAPIVPPAVGPADRRTHHGMVDVWGGAASFFSSALDSIVRAEMGTVNEPAFIPNRTPFERLIHARGAKP